MRLAPLLLALALAGCQCGPPPTPSCPPSRNACGTLCIDLRTDNASCGACGVVCVEGTACAGGQCYRTDCSAADCATNQVCQTEACRNRFCVGVICGAGLICNDGVCVAQSCGAVTCAATAACVLGECVDVDCRGVICPAGSACEAGICAQVSCTDLRKNGAESDVDCGLACSLKCTEGQRCNVGLDCASSRCDGGRCDGPECATGQTQSCGSSVGACRPGTRACVEGAFGPCLGGVAPSLEVCDELDNDCDGVVDPQCECPSGQWFEEPVAATGAPGTFVSAALDRDGGIHLAFKNANRLMYAHHAGSTFWRHELVPGTTATGRIGSLGYDPSGGLHLVFEATPNPGYLLYKYRAPGGQWASSFIDTVGSPGSDNGLVVDASGNVHVTTYDSTGQDLHYLFKPAGQPFLGPVVIASAGNVGEFSSIAVDAAGNIAAAFYDRTNLDLMFVEKRTGQAWSTPVTVDGAGTLNAGQYTAIALDAQGGVHISYQDVTALDLKYATRPAGQSTFTVMPLEPGIENLGYYTSIAVDPQLGVHIASNDRTRGDLRYAYRPAGGAFTYSAIDGADSVGTSASLRVDARGGHNAYGDESNDDVRLATKAPGATSFNIVPVVTTAGQTPGTSLATDGQGGLAIVYYDSSQNALGLELGSTAGLWQVETADDAGTNAATEASIAVDSTGGVHIAHYDGTLKYEYRAAGATGFTHQLASASNGRFPSLKVNTAGEPLIAYYDTDGNLALASRDGGTWGSTKVDPAGGTTGYFGISLQLFGGNQPFIAYRQHSRDHLAIAVADAGGFAITPVDTDGSPGYQCASALGPDGLPRIIYRDANVNSLRYARALPQGGWSLTTLISGPQFALGTGDSWPRIFVDSRGDDHVIAESTAVVNMNRNYQVVYLTRAAGSSTFTTTPVAASTTANSRYYDVLAHPSGRVDLFFYDNAIANDLRHRYRCP